MIDILEYILPYISGLYTLPWILFGFFVTILLGRIVGRNKIDRAMKKVGLVLLYFFIPALVFRIFLDNFEEEQIAFVIITSIVILFMYILAFFFIKYSITKQGLEETNRNLYLKTVLINQGRSTAFIGSAMMAYWPVEAGIFIALVGIALFAVMPYILSYLHKKESKNSEENHNIHAFPWFLKLYPWYLIIFVVTPIIINNQTGITTQSLGDLGVLIKFYTAVTIPAALYYVGASIHPSDLKISEMKKLIGLDKKVNDEGHWIWVRKMFLLTVIITPLALAIIFTPLLAIGLIPSTWFAVIIINSILPVTSTNMFLLPYGIDKKSTAHIITWTTIVCVPIVVLLITFFKLIFT